MRRKTIIACVTIAACFASPEAELLAADTYGSKEVVPLVVIEEVPLVDAIKNVMRQMNVNFILDPSVPGSGLLPGRLMQQPYVNGRWENVLLPTVLSNILQQHKFTVVMNPATSVARIAPAWKNVKPISQGQVGTNAAVMIPKLTMEEVTLAEAIRKLAAATKLEISINPNIWSARGFDREGTVSLRWENITAKQALAALLDNYDLVLVEEQGGSKLRITFRP